MLIKVFVINNFRLQRIPSLFVVADNQTFIINMPELTQRFLKENGVKMVPNCKIVVTGPTTDYLLGMPGYLLSSNERGLHIGTKIYGSGKIYDLLFAFKALFGLKFLYFSIFGINVDKPDQKFPGLTRLPSKANFRDFAGLVDFFNTWTGDQKALPFELQQNVIDGAEKIKRDSRFVQQSDIEKYQLRVLMENDCELIFIPITNTKKTEIAFCLLFIFFSETQKIDPEKLKVFGLQSKQIGELRKNGKIELADGKLVTIDDVKAESHSYGFFVIDSPSQDFVPSLIDNEFIAQIVTNENPFRLNYIFHLAKSEVALTPDYQKWVWTAAMQQRKNVYLSTDFDQEFHNPPKFRYRAYFESLSSKFPNFFPKLAGPTWDDSILASFPPGSQFHKGFNHYNVAKGTDSLISYMAENPKILQYIEKISKDFSHPSYEKYQTQIRKEIDFKNYPYTIILGTGSMVPSTFRNVSAILYAITPDFYTLMDCGEGTVYQLTEQFGTQADAVILKIQLVMITHLHGDHFFGLLDFMRYRANLINSQKLKNVPKLMILVPGNCLPMLLMFINFSEIQDSLVVLTNHELMDHYLGAETAEKLREMVETEMNKNPGNNFNYQNPMYIKSVEDYKKMYPEAIAHFLAEFEKNSVKKIVPVPVYHCPESVGFVVEAAGKKIVYSGDCRFSKQLAQYGEGADLLIHECTFDCSQDLRMVDDKDHSNIEHALSIAKLMKAEYTCLTHFSQRFRVLKEDDDHPIYLPSNEELLEYFKTRAFMAQDHLYFDFDNVRLLPEVHLAINESYSFNIFRC